MLGTPALASALDYPMPQPGDDMVGSVFIEYTKAKDTLSDVARRWDVGFDEIVEPNRNVDPWLPGEGTKVVVPTFFILPSGPRDGIVINVPEMRLYYFPKGGKEVITYPTGAGREGWDSPLGESKIVSKKEKPTWRPPKSILKEHEEKGDPLPEVVGPGPENPLGEYAMYMGFSGYLLHGTHRPYGVGMRVSHGCIRLYPEDIQALFPLVPVGTKVRIVSEPYKVGWREGRLYVEVHGLGDDEGGKATDLSMTGLVRAVIKALGDRDIELDWEKMKLAVEEQSGLPVLISLPGKRLPPAPPAGKPLPPKVEELDNLELLPAVRGGPIKAAQ